MRISGVVEHGQFASWTAGFYSLGAPVQCAVGATELFDPKSGTFSPNGPDEGLGQCEHGNVCL